jgi:hypothetical protein
MDEAVAQVIPFAAELCLKSLFCLCHLWGDYIFRLPNVVCMNQTGVSVEGDVMDDAGYYSRQVFLWMGAEVVDLRLLMNYVDVAVPNARANSQVLEDVYPLVGDLFAEFGGPLPWTSFQIAITSIWWMAWTSIYTSEHIAVSVPCSAWFLVDAAIGPLRSVEMSKVSAMFFAAMLRFGIMFSEKISNFKAHKFWKLIALAIEWLNFGIQWNLSLDLRDVFPLASYRAIMIWVDTQNRIGLVVLCQYVYSEDLWCGW